MFRNLFTVVLATLLLFVWGYFSWMVLPIHNKTKSFKDPSAVAKVLKENADATGVYELPNHVKADGSMASEQEWREGFDKGPFLQGLVRVKSVQTDVNKSMAGSVLISLITVLLIIYVLFLGRVNSKEHRVLVAIAMGMFVVVVDLLPAMHWYGYPLSYLLGFATDALVSSLLAGLVIAFGLPRFVGPGAD